MDEPSQAPAPQNSQWPLNQGATEAIQESQALQSSKVNSPDTSSTPTTTPLTKPLREPLIITAANVGSESVAAAPYPLTREKTGPAIGPPLDKPTQNPLESDLVGSSLLITLLLTSGARHPFKIDEKYLKKRNVNVDGNNPVNMSVYTLKELVWREWREGKRPMAEREWELRPSSPSSIRLIYFGKLLEDKSKLHGLTQYCRFEAGLNPHVVHMTVKPQDIVDEEDAKIAKTGSRDRDGDERSPGCRCVIL
ncbi:MAG: hypothetical protein LQ345_002723 [Seirophora villosa]|nr:MAG: hypothetical protein LQ345_002723 [Seirophora villosa]